MRLHGLTSALAILALCAAPPAQAQEPPGPSVATSPRVSAPAPLDSSVLATFRWRSVGPAHMGGRIADIEGIPSPSKTFFVATANGGIFKTTNDGVTFRPLFQHEPSVAMGDIAIAPSDTMEIWAGTGDEDSRNTISPGGGIYKSTDGGLTWTLMGLKNTGAIGRVVVDPRDPNTVYVAALGHAWGPNPERGLYKTTDGGQHWTRVKFISDKAGFVDVRLDPQNPDIVWAASWQRVRTPYSLDSGGPGSGLWKSTDAGKTWTEIKGGGFPAGMKGRIGIGIAASNPQIIYALVEAEKNKNGSGGTGLYRSEDGGHTWTKMNDKDTRPFYYSQIRVDPKNPNRVYWSSTPLQFSNDGGKTVQTAANDVHVDDHALWIDPTDPEHFVLGDDGGVWQTWDRGGNYEFLNNIAIGQFYHVSFDMAIPYNVCGGLQDNGAWCGPSRRARGSLTNEMWKTVGGGDGFVTQQDPTDPDIVYAESQNAGIQRMNVATGETQRLNKPSFEATYRMWADSIILVRGNTKRGETSAQRRHISELRRHQVADSVREDLRYNWDAPYFISPFDHKTLYVGGNRVIKSTDMGDHFKIISPDLSNPADSTKVYISMHTTGGITRDVTGAENFGTIVQLIESPIQRGMLFAGTDDGNVWISPDDGGHWNNISSHFRGVPAGSYVSSIEPSHFDVNTFYVAFDNHRRDDYMPYVFVTTDGGQTFRSLAATLPHNVSQDYVHVIREDPVNPDLLFLGTDIGAYVSMNRGETWQRFMTNLPSVPVRDLQVQPRDHELIAATFGRSLWIVPIAPLEQLHNRTLADAPILFQPGPGLQYGDPPVGGESMGQQWFQAPSPQYGASIQYYVPKGAASEATPARRSGGPRGMRMGMRQRARGPRVEIAILNSQGDTVQTVSGPETPGLHTATWNLSPKPAPRKPLSPSQVQDSIKAVAALHQVADSLIKSGMDRRSVERAVNIMQSGNRGALRGLFGGGGRRTNLAGERFFERPAESPPPQARQGRPGAPGLNPDVIRAVFMSMRERGIRPPRGIGGFFGGGPRLAPAGDYTVSVTMDGQTLTQRLRVIRAPGYGVWQNDNEGGTQQDPDLRR